MVKRKIIKINENKCNGCGLCIPNCPEGAIQLIDNKARLISDLFCDGLGACIGKCPQGAISIEEREAERYNEKKVMENIIKQGKNVVIAHLKHLKEHNEGAYLSKAIEVLKERGMTGLLEEFFLSNKSSSSGRSLGCPGAKLMDLTKSKSANIHKENIRKSASELRQWPVQLMLVPVSAPYLSGADILVAADCVPFAYAGFHSNLLSGKILLVACPKLDNLEVYRDKLKEIFRMNRIKSVSYAHMEVPCCFGLTGIIQEAISACGKKIPFKEIVISVKGEVIDDL